MGGIFISYRREDTTAYARLLSEALGTHFGSDRIFRDVDTLAPGADFPEAIAKAVGSCDVLLAVIGKRWLAAKREGKRRLDDPSDYVRLEIAAALDRATLVVPILIEDARMPTRQELPPPLAELADRNAHRLTDDGWTDGVRRLVAALDKVVTPVIADLPPPPARPQTRPFTPSHIPQEPATPGNPSFGSSWGPAPSSHAAHAPSPAQPPAKRKTTAVIAGAAVAAVALIVVVIALARGGGETPKSNLPLDANQFLAETNVSISPSTGPRGTIVTVTGSGFLANERIDIYFHADVVTQTRADGEGKFSGVTFAVPADAFRDQQYDVSATGGKSFKSGMAQFRVT